MATRWSLEKLPRVYWCTLAPLRSLVDAAVGVSLLASAPHAVAAPVTLAGPPAVVRTVDGSAGWDRAQQLLGAVHPSAAVAQPGAGEAGQLQQPPAATCRMDASGSKCR